MSKMKKIITNFLGAALLAAGLAQAAGAVGFDGNFGSYAGAHYDGGTVSIYNYDDFYTAVAVSSENVYAALTSGHAGNGLYELHIVKYGLTGATVLSSAPFSAGSVNIVPDMTVTPDGVYAVDNVGTGYYVVKYGFDVKNPYAASASVPVSTASAIAYDPAGNVYVAGWKGGDYHIVKFDSNLNVLSSVTWNAGGTDYGTGIAFGASSLYVIGVSSQAGDSYLALAKFNPADLSFVSSHTWIGSAVFSPDAFNPSPKIAFNPVTFELVAVATKYSTFPARDVMTARFSSSLAPLGVDYYSPGTYPLGTSVAVDPAGNILAGVKGYDGSYDFGAVIKYSPALTQVGISTFGVSYAKFVPFDIAVDSNSGVYAAGIIDVGDNGVDASIVKMPSSYSQPQGVVEGSEEFKMFSDGLGGAFLVFDSTVSPTTRQIYAKHVDSSGAATWGPTAISGVYPVGNSNDYFAGPDGLGGIFIAWFENGLAYADRRGIGGTSLSGWPTQISSGTTVGGDFAVGPQGSFFAVFGYDLGGPMAIVMQKVDASANCLWPQSGACNGGSASTGTILTATGFTGQGGIFGDGQGGAWLAWAAGDMYASKVGSDGIPAWQDVPLTTGGVAEGDSAVEGKPDGQGGMFLVWSSSSAANGYMPRLVARRFDPTGAADSGWTSELSLTSPLTGNDLDVNVETDGEGFAVLYSTSGQGSYGSQLRVVRSSAASSNFAPGWAQDGQLVGGIGDNGQAMVFDGSYYHIAWSAAGGPAHDNMYAKMAPSGYMPSGTILVGVSTPCLHVGIATAAAGGALYGWLPRLGGNTQPIVVPVAANAGPVTVSISAADIAPAKYVAGEETAVLRISPYTNNGTAVLSSMTVQLNADYSCTVNRAALYRDTDQNGSWNPGDALVSSRAVSCSSSATFTLGENVTAAPAALFVTLTATQGNNVNAVVLSSASFVFDQPMQQQAIYPFASRKMDSVLASEEFAMVPDNSGGAYLVYDSTVAAGGLRKVFVKHVTSSNVSDWGPTEISNSFTLGTKDNGVYAYPDGLNGVVVGWFENGTAKAQRVDITGTVAWTAGGVQVSSSVTGGGEFRQNPEGGIFAVFGYETGAGMVVAAQSVDSDGYCLWPGGSQGDCVAASTGTVINAQDFSGRGSGTGDGMGNFWFLWGSANGGPMELHGTKINAVGSIVEDNLQLASSDGDEAAGVVEAIPDNAGGVYAVWSSTRSLFGGSSGLLAARFTSTGTLADGWSEPLRVSPLYDTREFNASLASDEEGFAVLFDSNSYQGDGEVGVNRLLSSGTYAPGFSLAGLSLAYGHVQYSRALVYDGASYHMIWRHWEGSNGLYYQRMAKNGDLAFQSPYLVASMQKDFEGGAVSDNAGGALVGWKSETGGDSQPGTELVGANAGPTTVYISTAAIAPASYIRNEEGAALSFTPHTNNGSAVFSGLTVGLYGGYSCSFQTAALYFDANENHYWDPADRLVSSVTLGCANSAVFSFPAETITTQQVPYFVTMMGTGGDNIYAVIQSSESFVFDTPLAARAYPVQSPAKSVVAASESFIMKADGAGGAYLVYDSTVALGGLRQVFAKHVSGINPWGPLALSAPFYSGNKGDVFADYDGAGGLVAAWFQADGYAYAQRVGFGGTRQWGTAGNPIRVSSGPAMGGEFRSDGKANIFALFGYPAQSGMQVALQKINGSGVCQWPSPGDCASSFNSTGTAVPMSDFTGRGGGAAATDGSFWFAWGSSVSANMELSAVKVSSSGALVFGPTVLSSAGGSDEAAAAMELLSDNAGGVFAVWSRTTGGASALYARRFGPSGAPAAGWSSALQLTSPYNVNDFELKVARDQEGFTVLYSTGYSFGAELRVVRSSATAPAFPAGWSLNGQTVGIVGDSTLDMVYDGSNYHIAWNDNSSTGTVGGHQLAYQRMSPSGAFFYGAGGYPAATSFDCMNVGISTDGAGGALYGWKTYKGGAEQPMMVAVPYGAQQLAYDGTIQLYVTYSPGGADDYTVAISTLSPDIYPPMMMTYSSQTQTSPGSFSFTGLQTPATYYVQAWKGSGPHAAGMPSGAYNSALVGGGKFVSMPLYLGPGASVTGLNINLLDFGTASGGLSAASGAPVKFLAETSVPGYLAHMGTLVSTGAFSVYLASTPMQYTLKFWQDSTPNDMPDAGEFYASTRVYVNDGQMAVTGLDLNLAPYSEPVYGFSGALTTSTGAFAAYDSGDFDAGTGIAYYNNYLYAIGASGSGSLLVKYEEGGVVASSAVISGAQYRSIAVNAGGVYLAGGNGTDSIAAKYTLGLVLSSSVVIPSDMDAAAVALDGSGNVYVAGSHFVNPYMHQYRVTKYDASMAQQDQQLYDSTVAARVTDVAVDAGSVFVTGYHYDLMEATTRFVTLKADAATLDFQLQASVPGYVHPAHELGGKLAVNPVTHDVYLAASSGTASMQVTRFNKDLLRLGSASPLLPGLESAEAADVAVSTSGEVYLTGDFYLNGDPVDSAGLFKFSPSLAYLSGAARQYPHQYIPLSLVTAGDTGAPFVTGVYFSDGDGSNRSMFDMRTVRFAQLPGSMPNFYGDFFTSTGAYYNGGEKDFGVAAAVQTSTSVYVAGQTDLSGVSHGIVVRYDGAGTVLSSATLPFQSDGGFFSMLQNANGVYVAGAGNGAGLIARYDHYLQLVSSRAVAASGVYGGSLAKDASGNIYAAFTKEDGSGWALEKRDSALNPLVDTVVASTGSNGPVAIAVSPAADVYINGISVLESSTYYYTVKLASSLDKVSTAVFGGVFQDDYAPAPGIAVSPVTGAVYIVGTTGDQGNRETAVIRYASDLSAQSGVSLGNMPYGLGTAVAVSTSGYVYALGKSYDYDPAYGTSLDHGFVAKFTPSLVLLSSSAVPNVGGRHNTSFGLAVNSQNGYAYVAGVDDDKAGNVDMRTVVLKNLSGAMPLVTVIPADISPAAYTTGREAPALRLGFRTQSGTSYVQNIRVHVNPAGSYGAVTAVALYRDSNGNGLWDQQSDVQLATAAVTSAYADLPLAEETATVSVSTYIITLTPAAGSAGTGVNVAVDTASAITVSEGMALQAIYPIMSALKTAELPGSFSGDFSLNGGAVYAGEDFDIGSAMARNPVNGDLYVTGISSASGFIQSFIVRYSAAGVKLSSAPVSRNGGMRLLDVAISTPASSVFAAGDAAGTDTELLKYDLALNLVSSRTLAGRTEPALALDANSLYLASKSDGSGYRVDKFSLGLATAPGAAFVLGGAGTSRPTDIAADGRSLYVTGFSTASGQNEFVTLRADTGTLVLLSSAAYPNAYDNNTLETARLAVNPVTHDVYLAGSSGSQGNHSALALRYSQGLALLADVTGESVTQNAYDVALDTAGYVYMLSDGATGAEVHKFSPALVRVGSGTYEPGAMFTPYAMVREPSTGRLVITGGGLDPAADMRTVRMAAVTALLPVIHVTKADISPAFYMAGQEGAALRLGVYATGATAVTAVRVAASTSIAYVSLYSDDGDGAWNSGDALISSAAVAGGFANLDLGFKGSSNVGVEVSTYIITLTPLPSAEIGSPVRVVVPSTGAFTAQGDMALDAVYPAASAYKPVRGLEKITDLETQPGANLNSVSLSWTYPQDIVSGRYMVRYSTSRADLVSPDGYAASQELSGVTAQSPGSAYLTDLPAVTDGLRVFPYYFGLWLYNGTSTSAVSNLAQNLYYPAASAQSGDATVKTRPDMTLGYEDKALFARGAAGTWAAVSFDDGSYLALTAPNGKVHYYNDPELSLSLRDMAADASGNAYLLLQYGAYPAVIKVAPDGSLPWGAVSVSSNTGYAKAIAYGVTVGTGSVYVGADYENNGDQNFRLSKVDSLAGSWDYSYDYDSSGAQSSYDEVNGLAFVDGAGTKLVYAAGSGGQSIIGGRVHKFTDTGSGFTAAAGNWPVQYSNPSGDVSVAALIKADQNGNVVVAGYEQRYDLDQSANIWLNRYNSYGASLFPAPARYNNPQGNSDDVPTALEMDSYGGIYVAGYSSMWSQGRGYDLLLAKFSPAGMFASSRLYDSGGGNDDIPTGVIVSSDNYAHVAGSFGGVFGAYSAPLGASVNAQFFTAAEGAYTGAVDLMWNYVSALPAGTTYYIKYTTAAGAIDWAQLPVRSSATIGAQYAGAVQLHSIGGLPTLRYAGDAASGADNRGNLYRFRVWVGTSAAPIGEAQSFARTPQAYDNTQYFDSGRERLSYLSNVSGPVSALAVEEPYVYHAFGGSSEGGSTGFGLRKYNTDQYLEWTKFFNSPSGKRYQVNGVVRDAGRNFYVYGSEYPYNPNPAGPEDKLAAKDAWLAKLDANGDLLWSRSWDYSGGLMDEFRDMAAATENGVPVLYAVGTSSSVSTAFDVLAVKFAVASATAPAQLWAAYYDKSGGDDFGNGVAVATNAYVYAAATVRGDGDDMNVIAFGKNDGISSLAAFVASAGDEQAGDIAVVSEGASAYFYVAGSTAAAGGDSAAALYKYALGGAFDAAPVWSAFYAGLEGDAALYAVSADSESVLVAGFQTAGGQKNSIYREFIGAGASMSEEWSRGFDFAEGGDDAVLGLAVGASGRVYAAIMNGENPGMYWFPEPSFNVLAAENNVPGSVRLDWMSRAELPAGAVFYIQHSTSPSVTWSAANAQTLYVTDYAVMEGESVSRAVYGLNIGRDAQGNSLSQPYYFKVWTAPYPGASVSIVSDEAASAAPADGWDFESMVMYPNDAKLFVMGNAQQGYYYGSDYERELPGVARDSSGSLYALANMDWNGNGGLAVKKFNSAMAPQWTRFYAPGEWSQVKANRMVADAAGYVYITGYERPYGEEEKLFVLKFGPEGAVWKSTYSWSGGDAIGYGVTLDASGNVFVAGTAETAADDYDVFVARLNSSGVIMDSSTYHGSNAGGYDAAFGVAVHNGYVYAAGTSDESGQGASLWIGRFSTSTLGVPLTYTASNDASAAAGGESGYDIMVGTAGYVYVAGELFDAAAYSNSGVVLRSSADLTVNLTTTPANGLWANYFVTLTAGDNAAYGLGMDPAGSVYVTGVTDRYDVNQAENIWLKKYSQGGEELWSQEFNSSSIPGDPYASGANSDRAYDVAVGTLGYVSVSARINGYYGLYRYKQTNTLAVNPVLTVNVSSGSVSVPFPGVGVSLIPYAATGGIEAANIRLSVTDSSGAAVFQVPAGKQYFIALDKQGFSPSLKDQQMDPYGSYFVQLSSSDVTRRYVLTPKTGEAYSTLAVTVTSVTANDYVMAEVFFSQTGEKAAYGLARAVGSSVTFAVNNLPPAAAGAYTLGVTVPGRGLSASRPMTSAFPALAAYTVSMSTAGGAMVTSGGFEAGGSTVPASLEGVVRSSRTLAALQDVRVRIYSQGDSGPYNSYETLTDVNGKYSFYGVRASTNPYYVTAQKAGYRMGYTRQEEAVSITTAAAAAQMRDFRLDMAPYTLRGYLRYNGVAVPNADIMVTGDSSVYPGSDTYRGGLYMEADARTKTAADGLFLFSSGTANGLPDGQVRLYASFFGSWMDLNEGANVDYSSVDSDDIRVVISSAGARWVGVSTPTYCAAGRVWKLNAKVGSCQSPASGEVIFNIQPQAVESYATLSGSVTFVTTFTVTEAAPLVISSAAPVTVMALEESTTSGKAMGFAVLSGTYKVNYATYSLTLSTGVSYYTRVNSSEWAEMNSFDDRADFTSTSTVALVRNFTVTKAGALKGVVKLPDGTNYRPYNEGTEAERHGLDIEIVGQNVQASEGWGVDEYGSFEFPNLPPGLYTVIMRPHGEAFRWAAPQVKDVAVVAGKTAQVTLKLSDGLWVQPQILGLPEISTPTWRYVMIPVPSGTEMNQKKITELFFGENTFGFSYSSATQTFEKKLMLAGQYDFYLMMGTQYRPTNTPASYDHFGNFIGKVKGFNVKRSESTPNLGNEDQPITVSVLGSIGQETLTGTIAGERLFTDSDIARFLSNFNELFAVLPAVMIYDSAGDLRGYSAGMPTQADFGVFWAALGSKDPAQLRAYFAAHQGRFMVPGLPPGRYTAVFNNPNYPPLAKEIEVPLASSYNGVYAMDFDSQQMKRGGVYGTVMSAGLPLPNASVYLKHKTVEKYAVTDASGTYSFDNLPPGIYRVEVTREGYVKAGEKTSLAGSLAGDDSVAVNFDLVTSQSNMSGKVYMSRFPAPVTRSGVKIVAYDETWNTEHPTEYLPKLEATTNDSGEYEIAGVVPGHNYKVTAFSPGKLSYSMDIAGETVVEGLTYLPDIVMRDVAPQITVKARKSPDSANKVDVIIKSPKQLVTTPVCKVNPGPAYNAATAVSLMLVPGPNNTYQSQFTVSMSQAEYTVYVYAGDGSGKLEKTVRYSPKNQAKTEQYIQDESIQGGEVQMDKETEEYSGIELDAGGLTMLSSGTAAGASGYGVSAYSPSSDGLIGGFFSALPSVRTVKTEKGELTLSQAVQDLMASEVYDMELENAQANKPFTLTLKYDKEKAGDNQNLRIYKYDDATGTWLEVPGDYTLDPMLGVLSVGVANLGSAEQGAAGSATPLGRKRMGMSAVVNGRYVPSAGSSTSQGGRFAVFTALPNTGTAPFAAGFEVYNLPNPFNLKSKNVTLDTTDLNGASITNPYPTHGTVIKYNLPAGKAGSLKFVIYNLAGEKVRTIDEGSRPAGVFYSEWDGRNDNGADCASGVYFMLAYVDGKQLGTKAHKMAIIK